MSLDVLRSVLRLFFAYTAWPVFTYFLLINASYLLLLAAAAGEHLRHLRRAAFAGYDEAYASPLTQPVSVVVPAHCEEAGIVASVSALLALRYPRHEVVIVDDGSTDATFEALRAAHDLVQVPRHIPADVPTTSPVLSVHVPRDGRTPLVVVRRANGGRADAINTGINAARYDLVCISDADSVLDPDALLNLAKPFSDDPERVVATGGAIRAVNGSRVVAGRVVEGRMPTSWVARLQVVEYLRAFFIGRPGWSRLAALILISGAFGMYRRDVVVEAGGLDAGCIGEDMELTVRVHRMMREAGRPYRMEFVAGPVAWTEVPPTWRVLGRQRRRWHRGLWEVLWRHRRMIGNRAYGRIGLVALPYYVVFELVAPVLELAGVVAVPLGWALGVVDRETALLFVAVAYGFAGFVSIAALTLEEFSFARYRRWRDLALAFLLAVVENLGYRQLTALWRVLGLVDALRGTEQVWGVMTREGFGDGAASPVAADLRSRAPAGVGAS